MVRNWCAHAAADNPDFGVGKHRDNGLAFFHLRSCPTFRAWLWIEARESLEAANQRETAIVVDNFSYFVVNDSLSSGEKLGAPGIPVNHSAPGDLQSAAAVEVDKRKSSVWIVSDIPQRVEHPVTVAIGENDLTTAAGENEAGIATLVRHVPLCCG